MRFSCIALVVILAFCDIPTTSAKIRPKKFRARFSNKADLLKFIATSSKLDEDFDYESKLKTYPKIQYQVEPGSETTTEMAPKPETNRESGESLSILRYLFRRSKPPQGESSGKGHKQKQEPFCDLSRRQFLVTNHGRRYSANTFETGLKKMLDTTRKSETASAKARRRHKTHICGSGKSTSLLVSILDQAFGIDMNPCVKKSEFSIGSKNTRTKRQATESDVPDVSSNRQLVDDPKLNALLNAQDELNDDLPQPSPIPEEEAKTDVPSSNAQDQINADLLHPSPVPEEEIKTNKKAEESRSFNKSNRLTEDFHQLHLHLPNPLPPYLVVPGFLVRSSANPKPLHLPENVSPKALNPGDFVNQKEKKLQTDWVLKPANQTDFDQHELDAQEELAQEVQKTKRLSLVLPPENVNNFDESQLEESKRKRRDARDVSPTQPKFLLNSVHNGVVGEGNQICELGVISRILKFMASKVPTFVDSLVYGEISKFARTSCAPPPSLDAHGLPLQQSNQIQEAYKADQALHVEYYKPQQKSFV